MADYTDLPDRSGRLPPDPVVLVTRRWPTEIERELRRRHPTVRLSIDDRPLRPDDLRHALEFADVVLPTVTDRLPAELFDGPIRTRFLGNFGVGVDHIDLEAARRAGVTVTNTPGVLTDATADLALMLMLMLARRAGEGERQVRTHAWRGWGPTHLLGRGLRGRTLGIVGLGRIGRAVADRARDGFGMRVCHVGGASRENEALGIQRCGSIEDLLAESDVVSLHAPGGAANRHLIDERRLALMKPSAYLINTARGELVDEAALVDALAGGRLAGAALDVHGNEPDVHPDLLAREDVVLLPHLGSATEEARTAMGRLALDNLDDYLAGREPSCRVI